MSELLREERSARGLDGLLAKLDRSDAYQAPHRHKATPREVLVDDHLTYANELPPTLDARAPLHWLVVNPPTGTFVDNAEAARAVAESTEAIPARDQIALVTRFLGIGKSQVARIFGVSRQTIYDWLKGRCEPTSKNAANLDILARALYASCAGATRPLFHRYVSESAADDEPCVLELLERDPWSEHELTVALKRARRRTDARSQHLGQDHGEDVPRAQGKDNLLDNSIAQDLE